MKKPAFLLCIGVLLACSLSSCTSQLYINTLRPAEVAITNEQWKVVVLNRFNPALLPYDRERKIEAITQGAHEAFLGTLAAIALDSTYQLVHADTAQHLQQAADEPLSIAQIGEVYRQHPYHLLLALEGFEVAMHQETERIKNEDGSVSKTAYYTLQTKTKWALYDSTGRQLDRIALTEEKPYQSRPVISGLLAVGPSIGKAGPTINELAWHTGNEYWKRLYPQPVSYIRPYYSMKKLEVAAALMANENWPAAISLLTPIAQGTSKDAAKAAYNLAVIYEAMGRLEEARQWALQAKRQNNRLALLVY
ncbi:DUF6340 family protein [Cesiribacter andamanensis]|uniref:Tetratricopeptide repeat protein n=1 Tax=Cesiribacter andamanensis AMV16 TaxID=1279009 RepID=M7N859_9BACT|nr:DUF6340 family protein [Cesiribacter andamanensis]EMR04758.1 hypothetical protein ADICEAN_00029 [Cesiribacter andamanensis AMV16]